MTTELQKALATESLDSLCARLHVSAKRHPRFSNLVQFKYDQIESPMGDAIVQECRGIILDEARNWACVARPFDKFFNEGEGHAAKVDWSTARVQEKLDGSLIIMYWYANEWHVATSGSPDAGGQVGEFGFTFAELFWKTFGEMGLAKPEFTNITYMFELCTPYNRVVVQHTGSSVTLIGARLPREGWEFDINVDDDVTCNRYPTVRSFSLISLEEIAATFPAMEPTSQEGYVVVDANFNRIKIKNPKYVALHHARDGFGPRRMLEIAREGEAGEWLAYFPEFTEMFEGVKAKYEAKVSHLEALYEAHRYILDQKGFAMAIKDEALSGALFAIRNGKAATIRAYLARIPIASLQHALGMK